MKNADGVISHWNHLEEGFSTSIQNFYATVETTLESREVKDIETSRVTFNEGGFAGAEREYLRIKRRKLIFDICASPYGTGFFFSWWLSRHGPRYPILILGVVGIAMLLFFAVVWKIAGGFAGLLTAFVLTIGAIFLAGLAVQEDMLGDEDDVLALPVLGFLYARFFNPQTYYRKDTALMFQETVRRCVSEVVGDVRSSQGLRALSEQEQLPRIRDLAG